MTLRGADKAGLLTHVAARDWKVRGKQEEDRCDDYVRNAKLYTEVMSELMYIIEGA